MRREQIHKTTEQFEKNLSVAIEVESLLMKKMIDHSLDVVRTGHGGGEILPEFNNLEPSTPDFLVNGIYMDIKYKTQERWAGWCNERDFLNYSDKAYERCGERKFVIFSYCGDSQRLQGDKCFIYACDASVMQYRTFTAHDKNKVINLNLDPSALNYGGFLRLMIQRKWGLSE